MNRFLALLAVALSLPVLVPHAQADGNAALVELALEVQMDGEIVISPLITVIEGRSASVRIGNEGHDQYQADVLVDRVFVDDAGRQVVDIQWSLASAEADGPWTDHASGQIIALANAPEPAVMSVAPDDGPAVTVSIGNRLVDADIAAAAPASGD